MERLNYLAQISNGFANISEIVEGVVKTLKKESINPCIEYEGRDDENYSYLYVTLSYDRYWVQLSAVDYASESKESIAKEIERLSNMSEWNIEPDEE